jgi:hypothetical protein
MFIDKLKRQLDALENKKRDIQDVQRQLRDEIYKRCGMSPENVVSSVLNIERDVFAAQIDLVSKEHSKEAIAKQIAEDAENVKKNLGNDRVLKNLAELVQDRETALNLLEKSQGSGTTRFNEIYQAKAELSEAKIRLAIREEDLTKGNGDAGTGKLNLLIRENSLAVVQIRIRLDALISQCQRLRDTREMVEKYTDITEIKLPRVNHQIDRVSEKLLDESDIIQPDK